MASRPTVINGHQRSFSNGTRPGYLVKSAIFDEEEDLKKRQSRKNQQFEQAPFYVSLFVYLQYAVLIFFGYLRDLIGLKHPHSPKEAKNMKDFVPLYSGFESFYIRNMYFRISHALNRPISSVPGATVIVRDCSAANTRQEVINLGSYNYLGFAQNGGSCARDSVRAIEKFGVATCSCRSEMGNLVLHKKLEKSVAHFLGVDEAICFPMGFTTNASSLPSLAGKNCLILSDELNHASLVLGCRLSGARVIKFEHNDMVDLEKKLQAAIINGQQRTQRPYKKILICVEGVYSMEGSIVELREILRLKKKYKAYLYLDEAHSIGAIGTHGRGVCDYWKCNPKDVDVLMGTFTKSFGSAGGYIAGKKVLVDHIRAQSYNSSYATSMSAPIVQQIISTIQIINGQDFTNDGQNRIRQLHENSVYFRKQLKSLGFIIYGTDDSPVVPLMLYSPSKTSYFSRELLKRHIGVVVVGFPATAITLARARFCISASHTRENIDQAIQEISQLGDLLGLKLSRNR